MSNEGLAFIGFLLIAWGILSLVCQVTCARFTLSVHNITKWQKFSGIFVLINIGLTVLFILSKIFR